MNDAHKPPLEVYSAEDKWGFLTGAQPSVVQSTVEGALEESGRRFHGEGSGDTGVSSKPSPDSSSACPTCGRKPPAPKKQSKLRGSKTIKVPKDAQEDGVELLETLIAQVEGDLRPNERPRSPYYTLIEALYFFLTNAKKAAA